MFKHRRTLFGGLVLTLGVALALGWAAGPVARAQDQALEPQAPVGTGFTYQGQLTEDGLPATGPCDLRFALYDAASGGTQVGSTETRTDVQLSDGRFAVSLDFGGSAFAKDARWLEIAVKCAGDSVYTTLGRQALRPAPQALYSLDADMLDGKQASAFARASHNHLGQTWTGSNNPLEIKGSFGAPDNAPLVLGNSHTNGDGLRVDTVRRDGVRVQSPGRDGVYVRSAGRDGVYVYDAVRDGFTVFSAGSDGVYVGGVGNYSTYDYSGEQHGFEVGGAEGCGLRVGRADDDGVYIHSAGNDGVHVLSAERYGVMVSADGTGVEVFRAGAYGVEVNYAQRDGLYVSTARGNGVRVRQAYSNGLEVGLASLDGVHVTNALGDGVNVDFATGDFFKGGYPVKFRVLNNGEVRSDVGFNTPANDFAEMMTVADDPAGYEPGDVLVISADLDRAAERSSEPYSTLVLGVYSAAPGFVGGRSVSDDDMDESVPVAIVGIVPCKVSAENGEILRGDLLVTSATPGHAMRADSPPPGTILGKALEPLDASRGTGTILVLVTLQ